GAAIVLGAAALSAISGDTVRNDTSAGMASETAGAAEANLEADPGAREFGAVVTNAVQWEDVQLATDLAPFEDDRVWSGERYRLPGEAVATPQIEAAPTPELPPPPAFQVLGTAAATGGGLAVLRVGDGTPQLVTPGQRVEG